MNSWKNRECKPLYMSSIYNFRLLQLRKEHFNNFLEFTTLDDH